MSRWSGKRHPWKPAPRKVKAQLEALKAFAGKGDVKAAGVDSDCQPAGGTRRVIANQPKP